MKFTLSWLKQPLETTASLEQICETLTAIGLEVESLADPAAQYAPFTVALVESAEPHPDADKLKLCKVKTKNGTLQVVCGAPNARTGMKGIFAPEGSYIPGLDVTLKKTKIRGVESNGMLVSEKEMCLSDEHKGIIEVDARFEIGTPMAEVFGLNDPVIEINLTPNRADCAGVYGIARDLAAAGLGKLKPVNAPPVKGKFKSKTGVKITNAEDCPLFLGREIRGVKNGPSPEWLQNYLKSIGLRPISALVDITNFITHDHARPLHVYDMAKLKGDITIGTAKGGEELDALNDKSYTLPQGAVTINDASGVIALGGIVGGTSTGCTDATTDVYLEAAYFTPEHIARIGRQLGIDSDARYRFERGVDPAFTFTGMELFTKMVLEICGGEASEIVQAGAAPKVQNEIAYDPKLVEALIGLLVEEQRQFDILSALGFQIEKTKTPTPSPSKREKKNSNYVKLNMKNEEISYSGMMLKVTPPSWRGDIMGAPDLVEEIIRIIGFDSIPAVSVTKQPGHAHATETLILSRSRKARAALTQRGLNESITWSFIGAKQARQFGANDNQIAALTLQNPISSEMDVMRPSILPGLIEAALRNDARGFADAALCEIGPHFAGAKPEEQSIAAAGIRTGHFHARHWADANATRAVDVFDAKADALAALEACGAPAANAPVSRDAPPYYHPGRSGAIRLGPNVLAYFGEIHPGILADMGVKFPVVGFEVLLGNIPEAKKKTTQKSLLELEALQPLSRDFAFIVDQKVEANDIIKAALSADKNLLRGASVFDVYTGKGVDSGKKSVAIAVTIQPTDKTLTDKDIETLCENIIAAVITKTGGTLRS